MNRQKLAEQFIQAIKNQQEKEAIRYLNELNKEMSLVTDYNWLQVAGSTLRVVHETLRQCSEMDADGIIKCGETLQSAIDMNESSANTTLDEIDKGKVALNRLTHLFQLLETEISKTQQPGVASETFQTYFATFSEIIKLLTLYFQNIAMAQQPVGDLTGQLIKKVMETLQKVRSSLIQLIRMAKESHPLFSGDVFNQPVETTSRSSVSEENLDNAKQDQDSIDELLKLYGF